MFTTCNISKIKYEICDYTAKNIEEYWNNNWKFQENSHLYGYSFLFYIIQIKTKNDKEV